MKKMIVLAVMGLFGTQFAKAQVAKGDFLVGGNVGVYNRTDKPDGSDDKETTTAFGISPKVGYAISDKWMVGVFATTSFGTHKEEVAGVETKDQTTSIAPGIFVRNYHNLGSSKFAFFGEANVSYEFGQQKTDGTKTSSFNTINANVLPGIAYFVTKSFVLEGTFGGIMYANTVNKAEPSGAKFKTSEFGLSFTDQFTLGVSFLF
ncbi:outer membrane beta-barrel protein [Chitinophaga cymbidii]|uniref:Outer membrane protein beta-barrel domain-containing protein n=1 Tax=Chitinophaga cymbidii TaxID=1096750 RepID=A0A512RGP4_9BACT|nr:outer membrane beta-barrel protein [Chitinophaga cymbidii]GEP94869.1 hypothetical protein CCY01nite_11290 [Chitinophaga cymbidii]